MAKLMKFILPILIILGGFFVYTKFFQVSDEKIVEKQEPQGPRVYVETSLGSFVLELNPEKAPKTVANFLAYVDTGFYENTLLHRVISGFVIQGGGFEKGMKIKPTRPPIENESKNGLLNVRGSISMARKQAANSGTSQFFINLNNNKQLDPKKQRHGYAVFGKIVEGMDVIDKIAATATKKVGPFSDVPEKDILILRASQKRPGVTPKDKKATDTADEEEGFVAGEHYIVLKEAYPTRDPSKIEVLEAFSYGCGHCYGIDPAISEWRKKQSDDVDFVHFPAVWNIAMKLYAQTFYAAEKLNVAEEIHLPLFSAIVVEQKRLSNDSELAEFFTSYGVEKELFIETMNSPSINDQVTLSEVRTKRYELASVPEVIVNGKYRINPMRAGGEEKMFELIDQLVNEERELLKNK